MYNQYKIKICVIGEHAVGKTSLIKNFVEGVFSRDYRPTIGTNLYLKKMAFSDGENDYEVTLNLWDIAGQEKWRAMRRMYYQGTQGVFIVGDLSRKFTFEQIIKFWINDVKEFIDSSTPIMVIANKNDLNEIISQEEVRTILKIPEIKHIFFTSAKTGEGVFDAFLSMIKEIIGIDEKKELIPLNLTLS